ncbi:MAG: endonuclease III [Ignavibacteriae bacterium]|nr:endonuclease III [Ignavibacteriota bacterium]
MTKKENQLRINEIFSLLKNEYPENETALVHTSPFELLIATILSAQCTDARVNIVTEKLFAKLKTPEDFANVGLAKLEKMIYSTGFYKHKAKNIKGCCKKLVEEHNSEVPIDFDSLVELSGVGRKTASVVLGNAFNIPAVAVDTHVKRITNLLDIVNTSDVVKIEFKLKELLPKEDWANSTHWFIAHGRKICIARRPKCDECLLNEYCPSAN